MEIEWFPFLSFVFITLITPGPNNISCATMGITHGYRKTLPYILGIVVGVVVLMTGTGLMAGFVQQNLPRFELILRVVGAGYILWLAYGILRANYQFDNNENQAPLRFWQGIFLQIVNVKAIFFGLMIYTAFLSDFTNAWYLVLGSAIFFGCITFCFTSLWALFGSLIRKYMHQPLIYRLVNLFMAGLLVYTALEISGIFSFR